MSGPLRLGLIPFGSLNPKKLEVFVDDVGIVPNTTGSCAALPSLKNPTTQLPLSAPVADCPTPAIEELVIGKIGIAHGKSIVGKAVLSSV